MMAKGGKRESRVEMGKAKWTWRRKWILIVLTPLILALIAGAVHNYLATRALNHHLAAIHTQGYPVTLEERNAYYPEPPEGQNAADHYLKAFGGLVPRESYCPPDMVDRFKELGWSTDVATLQPHSSNTPVPTETISKQRKRCQ